MKLAKIGQLIEIVRRGKVFAAAAAWEVATAAAEAIVELDTAKQDKLTGTAGQVVGFDADGNAVAQNGSFADKAYVDGLVDAVRADMLKAMEKIACLVIEGSNTRINLKLKPFNAADMDYSLTYSGTLPYSTNGYLTLEPPPGYAFTGLASTWQPAVKIGTQKYYGSLQTDGSIRFSVSPTSANNNFEFVSIGNNSAPARFILEVA